MGIRSASLGYGADSTRQKFTGKERDDETGLDYFIARYHSPVQGRFTSVDPENAGADPALPQTWNGYSYTINNPLAYSDPDGLKVKVCDANGNCSEISDADANKYLFNKKYQEQSGYRLDGKGGVLDTEGNKIGTYQRTSFDDLSDQANAVIFGRGGLVDRAPALKTVVTGAGIYAGAMIALPTIGLAGGSTGATTLGINWGREAWRIVSASRPLEKMGHAAKHLKDFQQYANLSKGEVAKILEYVRQTGTQVGSSFGGRTLEKVVEIGGRQVLVRVVESAGGVIKTGFPVR